MAEWKSETGATRKSYVFVCSACNEKCYDVRGGINGARECRYKFCPNCGARMQHASKVKPRKIAPRVRIPWEAD